MKTNVAGGLVSHQCSGGQGRALTVLRGGYALGVATVGLMSAAFVWGVDSVAVLAAVFVVAGLHTAVQEAIESTVTAGMVPQAVLATGYGALGTVNGGAKLISSAVPSRPAEPPTRCVSTVETRIKGAIRNGTPPPGAWI